jgi:glutaredoxin 2
MSFLELRVYEHPSIPADEAWLVRRADAEEVPPEMRGSIIVPCLITGDATLLEEHLTLLHLAEAFEESGIYATNPATRSIEGVHHVEAAYA